MKKEEKRYAVCCPVCTKMLVWVSVGSSAEICCPRCKARVVGELDRRSLILKDFMVGYRAAE